MRRTLFRAKAKHNDKWYEGFLSFYKSQNEWYIGEDFGGFQCPVKEETIGQYTGLEDKNGVKIFEGDILKAFKYGDKEQEFTLEVSFLNGCFMAGNWNWHEFLNKFRCIEIIGNIYDNPELKGGK